ncbi:MAG: autotransporter-associated beta strand repeat-containing protein [Thermoguttaceae bacterium]|nr:autotransporter-associated beta strand repeat-containing protein [Thermoguttaceae bacterium]
MNSRNLAVFARFHRYTLSKLLLVLSLCANGVYAGVTYSVDGTPIEGTPSVLTADTVATVTDTASIGTKLTGTGKLTVQGTGTLTVDQWQGFTGGLVIDNGATVIYNAEKGSNDGPIVKESVTVRGKLINQSNATMGYGLTNPYKAPVVNIEGGTIISESSGGGAFILTDCIFTNGGSVSDSRTNLVDQYGKRWGGNIALDGRVKVESGDAVITAERIVLSSRYQLNNDVSQYTLQMHVAEGATLTINGSLQNVETNGQSGHDVATNPRSLHKSGTGTLILNQPSTYKGSTKLVNGTIKLGVDNAIPVTSPVTFGYTINYKGNIDLNGHNQTIVPDNYMSSTATTIYPIGSIYNDASTLSTLTLNIPSGKTIATDHFEIKGKTKLIVDGGGTLDIKQGQEFTGGTVIRNGKVFLAGAGALHDSNSYKDGALLNTITIEENGILELKSGGVMGYGHNDEKGYGMPIITINGGQLINNCDTHNLLYNTTLSNNALIEDTRTGKTGWGGNFGLDGTITVTSGTENVIRGEKLMLSSRYTPTVGTTPINVSANAVLTIDGNLMNPTGTISTDARNLIKSGDGLLILEGTNNTYKGATTVSAGELRLDSGSLTDPVALATNGITVSNGASLTLSSPLELTNSNALVSLPSESAFNLDFTLEELQAIGGTIHFLSDASKIEIGGSAITLDQLKTAIPADLQDFVIPSITNGLTISLDTNNVPEPASWLLLLFGLIGLKALKRRNK